MNNQIKYLLLTTAVLSGTSFVASAQVSKLKKYKVISSVAVADDVIIEPIDYWANCRGNIDPAGRCPAPDWNPNNPDGTPNPEKSFCAWLTRNGPAQYTEGCNLIKPSTEMTEGKKPGWCGGDPNCKIKTPDGTWI